MDKKIAGLLGAAAALAAATTAQAAMPTANSYRDLLDPIENAFTLLKADNAASSQAPEYQVADEVIIKKKVRHHHHHHHHND